MRCPALSFLTATLLVAGLGGCKGDEGVGETRAPSAPSTPSPNARILPSPLASVRGSAVEPPPDGRIGSAASAAALNSSPIVPPRPYPADGDLSAERGPPREASVLELSGEFAWPDIETRSLEVPKATGAPRDSGGVGAVRSRGAGALATRPELRMLVSPLGHLSVELTSPTYALPPGTQLRARSDRWGHVIVWPDQRSYRVAPRGALRAVFNERRVDVSPLLSGHVASEVPGKKLGFATARRKVSGPLGTVDLEVALLPGSGNGGILVCRLLLELARVQPSSELCGPDELPVEARYAWERGGELVFRVGSLQRHAALPASDSLESFDIPPAMPIFKPGELPPEPSALLWSSAQRVELWGSEEGGAELRFTNPLELPMYVIVDRLPLARVPALSTARWLTARRARSITFRDFLGEHVFPAQSVEAPSEVTLGPVPAPAPPEPLPEAEPATLEP